MSKNLKKNAFASITVLFWSLAFPLTKVAVGGLSVYSIGLLRSIVAALMLLAIGKATHLRKPFCKKDLLLFMVCGLLGFALYLIFFSAGMVTLSSATSSIVIAMTPVVTALGARIVFGERLRPLGWGCLAAAFGGVCVILLWNDVLTVGTGILWTGLAMLCFTGYNLINRKLFAMGYTSAEVVTWSMCFAALELMVFLPRLVSDLPGAGSVPIAVTIFLGITASAVAYGTWAKAMELAEKISEVTNYMFITPVLAALEGALLLREAPDAGTYLGGALILISVIVFNLKGKQ